jgi:LysR substrate binding domain
MRPLRCPSKSWRSSKRNSCCAQSALTQKVISGQAKSRLVISAFSSVAVRWLGAKLAAFALSQRALRLDVRIEDDPVDFARHDIDLRVCYGSNLYPDMNVIRLCQDEVMPMCSLAYLQRNPAAGTNGMNGVPDDDDLDAGRLMKLSTVAIGLRHPYCLIHPHSKVRKEGLMPLIGWLTRDLGGTN